MYVSFLDKKYNLHYLVWKFDFWLRVFGKIWKIWPLSLKKIANKCSYWEWNRDKSCVTPSSPVKRQRLATLQHRGAKWRINKTTSTWGVYLISPGQTLYPPPPPRWVMRKQRRCLILTYRSRLAGLAGLSSCVTGVCKAIESRDKEVSSAPSIKTRSPGSENPPRLPLIRNQRGAEEEDQPSVAGMYI